MRGSDLRAPLLLGGAILVPLVAIAVWVRAEEKLPSTPPSAAKPPELAAHSDLIAVNPPPFSEGVFPCSNCHDNDTLQVNTTPRELKKRHKDIVLHHDEANRWCLDCHDANNRDKLHLASGKLIDFTESYKLCGQCHGPTLRDWKAGEHGKRTGSWSGQKQYLLCATCHNPHSPKFKPLEPKPAPVRPENLR